MARLIRLPRPWPLLGGLGLCGAGFVVLALLAHFGISDAASGAPGLQLLLVGVGVASQLLIIAGALLSCVAFEERCSSCRALPREHSFRFPVADFVRLAEAARTAGPLALLGLLEGRSSADGGACASLEVAVCSGCGRCGRLHVSRRAWCPVRKRFVIEEETVGVERSPWLLQQLSEAALAAGD